MFPGQIAENRKTGTDAFYSGSERGGDHRTRKELMQRIESKSAVEKKKAGSL